MKKTEQKQEKPKKIKTETNSKSKKATKKKKSNFFASDANEFKRNKKLYYIIFASLAFVMLSSLTFIIVDENTHTIHNNPTTHENGWPSTLFAPYADMTMWVPISSSYSVNGVPDLAQVSDETGIKYFNLGFIQPDMTTPTDSDGNIRWCWGGYSSISENGADAYQYAGIIYAMEQIRARGGDYCISVGGQAGDAPWVVSQNVEKLKNMYLDIVETYNVKRLDLDIEESNQGEAENKINAKAIKQVQNKTGVSITLTIPIMPYGWENKQIKLIRAYLDAGVDITLINSMTMCYGAGVYQNEDYGDASVRAIKNSITQLKEIYSDYGINLTDAQAYAKTGATVSIGYENYLYPTFTTAMTQKVVNDANTNGYGMVSYWSINRDAKMEENRGISSLYQFYDVTKKFPA